MSVAKWQAAVLIGCIGFFGSSCASTADESPAERRAIALEEDNENLRRQIEDLGAVETALSRELDAHKGELNAERNHASRLGSERERLVAENGRLKDDLETLQAANVRRSNQAVNTDSLAGQNIDVSRLDDGSVAIRLGGTAMFKPGQDALTKEGRKMLNRVAKFLKSQSSLKISVEGHTDATPLGKSKAVWGTNLALSLARAMAVQDYLKNDRKVADRRMRVVGYGSHKPLVAGKSKVANMKNRRVELVLYRS